MSTSKRISALCTAITIFTVVLTILLMSGRALGIAPAADGDAGGLFTADDLDAEWDTASATRITLSDSGSAIDGNGAYLYDGDIYIAYPGRYVLSGTLTDGSIVVDANSTDQIRILLDSVEVHCGGSAALRIEQAGKVVLTLAEGTENTLSSGAQYDEDAAASGVDGTVYSRDDLTINGSGSLTVRAEYKHGIVCNDHLVIAGGNLTVHAAQDGIHAHDSVRIRDAALSISAGDDGITASNDDETAFLYVASGSISIPACYEGLEAIDVTIAGGTIDIMSTDDGINANGSGAGSVIRITGGDITITNPSGRDADGLDSNGSIYIEGGRVLISVADSGGNSAIDYGSENGGECVVSGGTVIACGSSMMAEGFDAGSPQGFLMYSGSAEAGTAIVLEDSAGRELLSAEIPCGFSSAVLSAPGMQVGDTCTLTVGGVGEQVTIDNTSSSGFAPAGGFGGGMRGTGGRMGGGFPGGSAPDGGFPGGDAPDDGIPEGGFPGGDAPDGSIPDESAPGGDFQPAERPQPMDPSGGGMPDRQNGGRPDGGFPGGQPDGSASASIDGGSVILLAVSCTVLLAGLAIAFKFRR